MVLKFLFLFAIIGKCSSVIYHLNETEYDRMPPLFGLDANYDKCLRQDGGVYCVAKFDLVADPHNELMNMIREYTKHEIKHYNHSFIDRAVCVTESCKKYAQNKNLHKTADLSATLEGCINETIWKQYGLEAKLGAIYYCDRHGEQATLDIGDWILGALVIILVIMNLIGSVYDVWCHGNHTGRNHDTGNPYLLCFSIFQSWKKLTKIDNDPKYERLVGLHGLKSILISLIASSHIMWLVGIGFTDNPRDFEMSHSKVHYQLVFSGMVIVQAFFVIAGFLLAYNLQVSSETYHLTWSHIPKILFYRCARLTPSNAIMIAFTATWLRHLGFGPLWQLNVGTIVNDCRVHWWQHLLFFNNYVKQDKSCAIQTWHVAAEIQLFSIGLIVHMATISRGRKLALTVLGLAGMIGPALHVWLQDLDALVMHRPEFYRNIENDTYRSMHVLGHNNVSSYAIGMATGFFSYYCIKNKIEFSSSKFLKYLIWCIPLATILLFLSGGLFYVDGERSHVLVRMAYAATQRPALGIMAASFILNFVFKFEDGIRAFLEWRGWVVTSRLTYSVYLLHVNFIHILLGSRTQLSHVSFFHVIINHCGVVSLTFLVSIPFYLMVEAPMTVLAKNILLSNSLHVKQKKS